MAARKTKLAPAGDDDARVLTGREVRESRNAMLGLPPDAGVAAAVAKVLGVSARRLIDDVADEIRGLALPSPINRGLTVQRAGTRYQIVEVRAEGYVDPAVASRWLRVVYQILQSRGYALSGVNRGDSPLVMVGFNVLGCGEPVADYPFMRDARAFLGLPEPGTDAEVEPAGMANRTRTLRSAE